MQTLRRVVLILFYAACVCIVLVAMLFFGAIVLNPFGGFAGSTQFANRSGPSAKRSMNAWPTAVDPSKVRFVSLKHDYSIDSHSTWYKIELDHRSSQLWADSVHADRERYSRESLRRDDRGLEGVRRIVPGPPPLHSTTGDTPEWWSPPSIDFRATEAMKWYSGYDSGVGQAAYTGYDADKQVLWVYEYACQHDRLWEPNQIPNGDVFSRLEETAEPSDAPKPPNGAF